MTTDLTAADWAAMRKHEVERTILDRGWPTYTEEVLLLALDALARQQEANARLTAALAESTNHDACHDIVCNGDRRVPRGFSGRSGCSCDGRDDAYMRFQQAEAALADRDATIARLQEATRQTVMNVWNKWRMALPDRAFTHSDGIRFVDALDEALLTPAKDAEIARLREANARLTAENARLAEALRIAKHDVEGLLGAAHDMQGEVAEAVLVQAALADRDATIARLTAELQEIANGG